MRFASSCFMVSIAGPAEKALRFGSRYCLHKAPHQPHTQLSACCCLLSCGICVGLQNPTNLQTDTTAPGCRWHAWSHGRGAPPPPPQPRLLVGSLAVVYLRWQRRLGLLCMHRGVVAKRLAALSWMHRGWPAGTRQSRSRRYKAGGGRLRDCKVFCCCSS